MKATIQVIWFLICFCKSLTFLGQQDSIRALKSMMIDGPKGNHQYAYFVNGRMFFRAATKNDNSITEAIINSRQNRIKENVQYLDLSNDSLGITSNTNPKEVRYLVDTCYNYTERFVISGLSITKENFFQLRLKKKHIQIDSSFYSYVIKKENNCIEQKLLKTELLIPVKLNSIKLKEKEKTTTLEKIQIDKLYSIKRKLSPLGKSYISIRTK